MTPRSSATTAGEDWLTSTRQHQEQTGRPRPWSRRLEEAKLQFQHKSTSKINAAERDLAAMVSKHVLDQNSAPRAAAASLQSRRPIPSITKLSPPRDDACEEQALETALDELRAKFDVRRTDINNALEDEKAKVTGG